MYDPLSAYTVKTTYGVKIKLEKIIKISSNIFTPIIQKAGIIFYHPKPQINFDLYVINMMFY